MKKIWFDVSGLYTWQGNFTGIQRVAYNLANELQQHNPQAGFFVFRHGAFQEVSFDALRARLAERQAPRVRSATAPHSFLLNRVALQHGIMVTLKDTMRGSRLDPSLRRLYGSMRRTYRKLRQSPQHVSGRSPFQTGDCVVVVDGNWQFPGFLESLARAKKQTGFAFVHLINDIIAVRNPALVNTGAEKIIGGYFKHACRFADTLITISDATTEDVRWFLEHQKIPAPPIVKLTLGDNIMGKKAAVPAKPSVVLDKAFILAVSTIEIRKNYLALYNVYKLARQAGITLPQLVIVGRKGWMAQETYTLLTKDPEIGPNVVVMEHVSDPELEWLYQRCMFTVFPSFSEGWGLPVAESLAHGKVCISSNVSSMPEVGGTLARYASPYDPKQFMEVIAELAGDHALRRKLEQTIADQYHRRTWPDVYTDFAQILGSLG